MTKAFISYHHGNDRPFKEQLSFMANRYGCFHDVSVQVGDIPDDGRSSESIRQTIRDNYLKDSEVTILLCGLETRDRKHVDWELKSSMIDGSVNRKSGILVINLPGISESSWHTMLPGEKSVIYPDYKGDWISVISRSQYENRYPYLPARIVDQLMCTDVTMSVVPWKRVADDPDKLRWLIDKTAIAGRNSSYDLSRKMRRRDHSRAMNFLAS